MLEQVNYHYNNFLSRLLGLPFHTDDEAALADLVCQERIQ
jgi:hypothetical protein